MGSSLITDRIWSTITSAARSDVGDASVAVAYFGAGASKLLPLKRGSRLVVDFSERAVKSGQTCPSEILKLMRRGLSVYSVPNLHAKVFVFSNRAFIGSTNASRTSATVMVEAVLSTDDRKLVTTMGRFVRSLCLNQVTLNEALQMEKLYRPPKFALPKGTVSRRFKVGRLKRFPILAKLPPIHITQLGQISYDAEQRQAQRTGEKVARQRLRDSRYFVVDDFLITGSCDFVVHETVIQVTELGHRKKLVSPPAKVVNLEQVALRKPMETVVFVEMPKNRRRKSLKTINRQFGRKVGSLLCREGMVHDHWSVEELLSIWPLR